MRKNQDAVKANVSKLFPVKYGWKPGAISKHLLRALNKAKLRRSVVEHKKLTRKTKKHVEEKPALIVSRKDGEYRIEMQTMPNSNDGTFYSPLIYRVDAANNLAKIKKKERKQRRLIRDAANEIWKDLYHPENCEKLCRSAYEEAIGYYRNRDEEGVRNDEDNEDISCSCSDEEISSSCSSSDIDWEIQFSPPSAFLKQVSGDSS